MNLSLGLTLSAAGAIETPPGLAAIQELATSWYSDRSITATDRTTLPNLLDGGADPLARVGGTFAVGGPITLDGASGHHLQLPASDTPTFTAAAGKYAALVVHQFPVADSNGWLFSTESASSNGARLRTANSGANFTAEVGGASTNRNVGYVSSVTSWVGAALVIDDGTGALYYDGALTGPTSITTAGTITHAAPRVGVEGYGTALAAACLISDIVIFQGVAPIAAEIGEIVAYLTAS